MKRRPKTGERSDARAKSTIEGAGWKITQVPGVNVERGGRFVARKPIPEREDDTTTFLFESSYTLEALAKQVVRREEEEAR